MVNQPMLRSSNYFSERTMIKFIVFFKIASFSFPTLSHELSNGYLTLKNDSGETLSGELLLKPKDIGQAARLDTNNDGNLTWGEVRKNHNLANSYIQNHLISASNHIQILHTKHKLIPMINQCRCCLQLLNILYDFSRMY